MNRDFLDMLSALSVAGADYLIVGAHAVAVHGRPRATGDLDITDIGRVTFEEAWQNRVTFEVGDLLIPVIGRAELIRAKLEAGRPRDLADVAELEGQ